jgi:hypothetical protein
MSVRTASSSAEQAAVAAAGLTAEIARYERLASERRERRVRLWSDAQAGGMSYARIGALCGIHASKVHEAVRAYRDDERRRRRRKAS